MADVTLNIQEPQPEIPQSKTTPREPKVPDLDNPIDQLQSKKFQRGVITSARARQQTRENLEELTRLTGRQFNF